MPPKQAFLYEKKKEFAKAIYYYKQSLGRYSYGRISSLEILLGNLEEAQSITKAALVNYPSDAKLHFNMGIIYYRKNKILGLAISEVKKAYELSNDRFYLEIISKIKIERILI